MGDGSPKQKERFSRAWVIAAAAAADFTYEIVADDERGVDMTVHSLEYTIDFQLKATSNPEVQDGCLVHDLDVRTYDLLRSERRSGYGVLAVIVVGDDTATWHVMDEAGTTLTRTGYYFPLLGLPPTSNQATIRLKIPTINLLTADAMKHLMDVEAPENQQRAGDFHLATSGDLNLAIDRAAPRSTPALPGGHLQLDTIPILITTVEGGGIA